MKNDRYIEIVASIFERIEEIAGDSYYQGRKGNDYQNYEKSAEIDDLLSELADCCCETESRESELVKWAKITVFWFLIGNALIVCGYLWYGLFFGASLLEILFC